MKKLITDNIVENVRKLGLVKAVFTHMEQAYMEAMAEIVKGLVAGTTTPVAIHGCINSSAHPNYIISAGAIWHNGEVFTIPAFAGTAPGGQIPRLVLSESKTQLTYTDNTNQDTLVNRTYAWAFGTSGSGLGDFSALISLATVINNTLLDVDGQLSVKANLASPALTGLPTAPTAAPGTNTTQLATTAFVKAAIDAIIASAPGALDTLNELAAALGDDANFASTVTSALALKAPLASPALTGTPTAPTAAPGTNTTQISTTAFVQAAITAAIAALNLSTLLAAKSDKAKPAWTNFTLLNGWANAGVNPPRYRITDQGDIEIAAYLSSASAISAVFAQLPNGTGFTSSHDAEKVVINQTDGTFHRLAISGGSPPSLQIVGYATSKQYAVFISIPTDAGS